MADEKKYKEPFTDKLKRFLHPTRKKTIITLGSLSLALMVCASGNAIATSIYANSIKEMSKDDGHLPPSNGSKDALFSSIKTGKDDNYGFIGDNFITIQFSSPQPSFLPEVPNLNSDDNDNYNYGFILGDNLNVISIENADENYQVFKLGLNKSISNGINSLIFQIQNVITGETSNDIHIALLQAPTISNLKLSYLSGNTRTAELVMDYANIDTIDWISNIKIWGYRRNPITEAEKQPVDIQIADAFKPVLEDGKLKIQIVADFKTLKLGEIDVSMNIKGKQVSISNKDLPDVPSDSGDNN